MMMSLFRVQNGPFFLNKFLKVQTIVITYIDILALFTVQNSSCGSRVMWMRNFCAQNGPFPQMRIFSENLLMSLVSFIHAYLHAKNQSQVLIY